MCGFAVIYQQSLDKLSPQPGAEALLNSLRHRGPDGNGVFESPADGLLMVHTRLSVIDPDPRANQPLFSDDGCTIVYNGEIYNYRELAEWLKGRGVRLKTTSDTEVLLELFREVGAEMIHKLRGMYAFVIWDAAKKQLFAARDPFGIKPLYIRRHNGSIAFASEVRTLLGLPWGVAEWSPTGVASFLRQGFCLEQDLPVQNVSTIYPGSSIWIGPRSEKIGPQRDLPFSQTTNDAEPKEASHQLRERLLDSVKAHMVSDVPVCLFLSGGMDSTAVADALASTSHVIDCLSLGVRESLIDESSDAAETARRLGLPHHIEWMTKADLNLLFRTFLTSQDLPSVDGFNSFCIARAAASRGFKVALSGLGGDELLGGYPSFQRVPRLLAVDAWLRKMRPIRAGVAAVLGATKLRKASRLAGYFSSPGSVNDAYSCIRGVCAESEVRIILKRLGLTQVNPEINSMESPGDWLNCQFGFEMVSEWECRGYMLNQLLRDVDVMSMAHGVEVRVPFLDLPLWESVCRLPSGVRFAANKGLLAAAFPQSAGRAARSKKQGFSLPWDAWLSEALREEEHVWLGLGLAPRPAWFQKLALASLRCWSESVGLRLQIGHSNNA